MLGGLAVLGYSMVNMGIGLSNMEGGGPSERDGRLVLEVHGRLIREITRAEYNEFRTKEWRAISGTLLLWYYIPFAYFMYAKKDETPSGK